MSFMPGLPANNWCALSSQFSDDSKKRCRKLLELESTNMHLGSKEELKHMHSCIIDPDIHDTSSDDISFATPYFLYIFLTKPMTTKSSF